MEKIDKDKTLAYINSVDDLSALKDFQTDILKYKDLIIEDLSEQLTDFTAEAAATTTPFTYIAFKIRQLQTKIEKISLLKDNVSNDLAQITLAITKKINVIEKQKK